MTRHSDFKMESRRYGSGYVNCVQIVCGYCSYEVWHPAKNGGWAMRIFRAHGWKVGSKESQHRCPKCFGKAMASRRIPDNPVIPKELGKMLKTKIVESHVRDALLGSSALVGEPLLPPPEVKVEFSDAAKDMLKKKPAQDPLYVADVIVPAGPASGPPASPVAESEYLRPVRGTFSTPGRTQWRSDKRQHAAAAATKATGSVDGVGFYTVPLGNGWTWKHTRDTTLEERQAWLYSRKMGPSPKPRGLASPHGPMVDKGATITQRVVREDGTVSTLAIPFSNTIHRQEQQEEPTMAVVPMTPKKETPMAAQPLDAPRQPTRDDRTLIHDELTKRYDVVAQRYEGNDSDALLAGRLNVPRVWVTEMRAMLFGDHDRNSQSEVKKRELDAAIEVAKAAVVRLMEMAAEAEALEVKLVAARKALT